MKEYMIRVFSVGLKVSHDFKFESKNKANTFFDAVKNVDQDLHLRVALHEMESSRVGNIKGESQ